MLGTPELVIGLAAPITSLDPLFHNLNRNNSLLKHVFETLVTTDALLTPQPGLATSWRALNETKWHFTLRPGVRWHDGSAFTADDVIATLRRAPHVPNSPASFAMLVKPIVQATAPDAQTLVLTTATPRPGLPRDLTHLHIVSRAAASAQTADYDSGRAMIGTGPFTFVDHRPGERVALARHDDYWGRRPHWARVRFRMIGDDRARVGALLTGEAQMIDGVPTSVVDTMRATPSLRVSSALSNRLIYLHLDVGRAERSPFIRSPTGTPLDVNPLRDVRVRRAISQAIDRTTIVERVMHGLAVPAGQFLADRFSGTSARLAPMPLDVDGARRLLADAGYGDGFQVTLHAPEHRYMNDARIAEAVAGQLSRVGIATVIETMPPAEFFERGARLEFSFALSGWGSETGDTISPLRALVGTFEAGVGRGAANWGRYSDGQLDALIDAAMVEGDEAARERLLVSASERAIAGLAIIPLHYECAAWAMDSRLTYAARADQYTLAYEVMPAAVSV